MNIRVFLSLSLSRSLSLSLSLCAVRMKNFKTAGIIEYFQASAVTSVWIKVTFLSYADFPGKYNFKTKETLFSTV